MTEWKMYVEMYVGQCGVVGLDWAVKHNLVECQNNFHWTSQQNVTAITVSKYLFYYYVCYSGGYSKLICVSE